MAAGSSSSPSSAPSGGGGVRRGGGGVGGGPPTAREAPIILHHITDADCSALGIAVYTDGAHTAAQYAFVDTADTYNKWTGQLPKLT